MPQAADDGQAITCRVTAGNAAGALAAEPGPILVTRTPPVAVAALADVTAEEGTEAPTIDVAAAFAGEGLGFAVTGAGATIDPVSGRLTVPTDAVLDGAVVHGHRDELGGAAAVDFRVTITARPTILPPLLLAAPVLAGAGKIGSALSVDTGRWGGLPEPTLSVKWLRDGVEIAGATGPSYMPVDADDRCALACRVTALSSAGMLATETAAITATHVAPELVGGLFDEVFDQGAGPETVATAQVFSGRALVYAATGGGATIDPATGACHPDRGGALRRDRHGHRDEFGRVGLGRLPADDRGRRFRISADAGRRRTGRRARCATPHPRAGAGSRSPARWWCPRASSSGSTRARRPAGRWILNNRVMTPGAPYTTSSSMAVGTTCHNVLSWRRVADGAWAEASTAIVFEIRGSPWGGAAAVPGGEPDAVRSHLRGADCGAEHPLRARLDRHLGHPSANRRLRRSEPQRATSCPARPTPPLERTSRARAPSSARSPFSGHRTSSSSSSTSTATVGTSGTCDRHERRPTDALSAYSDLDFGPNVRNSEPRGWSPNSHLWRSSSGAMTRP